MKVTQRNVVWTVGGTVARQLSYRKASGRVFSLDGRQPAKGAHTRKLCLVPIGDCVRCTIVTPLNPHDDLDRTTSRPHERDFKV